MSHLLASSKVGKRATKGLRTSLEIHREIKLESATTGEGMEEVVERVWRAYKAGVNRTDGTPPFESALPPKSDNTMQLAPEIREWLDIVQRAVRVSHAEWRAMLGSIRNQLRLVAKVADDEQSDTFQPKG
jgi:hypothetical protein